MQPERRSQAIFRFAAAGAAEPARYADTLRSGLYAACAAFTLRCRAVMLPPRRLLRAFRLLIRCLARAAFAKRCGALIFYAACRRAGLAASAPPKRA